MKNKKLLILIMATFLSLMGCSASSSSPVGISCNPPNPNFACFNG